MLDSVEQVIEISIFGKEYHDCDLAVPTVSEKILRWLALRRVACLISNGNALAPGSIEKHACDAVDQDTTGINLGLAGLNMHIP